MTPEQIAAELRKHDHPYAFAIGCIEVIAGAEYHSDAEARAAIRDVLAALNIATSDTRKDAPVPGGACTPRVYDREPSAEVTSVCDREGDEWCRVTDGWYPVGGGGPLNFPDLRDTWGPITAWPGQGDRLVDDLAHAYQEGQR